MHQVYTAVRCVLFHADAENDLMKIDASGIEGEDRGC